MSDKFTFVLGGARSGKSDFAQSLAKTAGGNDVLFVATAQALDQEMQVRIARHRASRPSEWKTLLTPRSPARALLAAPAAHVVLLDCVTFWVSNVLLEDETRAEASMLRELEELVEWYRKNGAELILVSNEVGMSVVPDNPLGREYRDLLGMVNKKLARAADTVYLVVAGIPMRIKPAHRFGEQA